MTHKELVEAGKKWLWSKCDIVVTEMTTWAQETPDVIGWKSGRSTLIECKTNRQDFLNDRKKSSRRLPEYALGSRRYYLALENVIYSVTEIPDKWGLLVLKDGKVRCLKKSEIFFTYLPKEMLVLISCIRRIGQNPPDGISVRAYKYKTKQRASIGVREE